MREIFIKYNPYRLETSIAIDGVAPKQNSRLNFDDCRLQEWIEELPEILFEECSSRDFKITFHGTILDYEDVEAMACEAKKNGLNIELEHIPAKEVSDKEIAIDEIFDEIQAGPFDELKQPDMVKAFNMAKSSDFEVNVVATMSAGKSTLINALLRQKLMPAKQEACTATITEIKDNDADHFMLSYARSHLPNLFVPFDGECLENDEIKWNNDVMNRELVQLVNNFSEVRIVHLKKVVSKVLAAEANKIRCKRLEQNTYSSLSSQSTIPPIIKGDSLETKKDAQQKAIRVLRKEGDKIQKIMLEVTSRRTWNLGNINDMERAAKEILKAAQEYKNNK